eukprot:TRINITY_DN12527_c0_g1_i1.p2 TRINITY_DN12527_c0_g1~~TRINITY_DN12527_c0_g1_i1.p2  ORF type:complete len:114 (+),score=51.27 TRINITY_DN12527_c0_g1_i1:278-619(+)
MPTEQAAKERKELARIIEEGIYTGLEFEGHDDPRLLYLEEELLPTLVPALKELLLEASDDRERLKKSTLNPIDWLAQYLMRNNPRYSDALLHHPYSLMVKNHTRQVRGRVKGP